MRMVRALLCAFLCVATEAYAGFPQFTISPIIISDGFVRQANSIGNNGLVAVSVDVNNRYIAGVYDINLGTISTVFPENNGYSSVVNDNGLVGGTRFVSNYGASAFLSKSGVIVDIGSMLAQLGASASYVTDINNSGVAIGPIGYSAGSGYFRYEDGNFHIILGPAGQSVVNARINDNGTIAYNYEFDGAPYLLETENSDGYPIINKSFSGGLVQDINNNNSILLSYKTGNTGLLFVEPFPGTYYTTTYASQFTSIFRAGIFEDVFAPTGYHSIEARSINNNNQFVGSMITDEGVRYGFLYSEGKTYNLNFLVGDKPSWEIIQATKINDRGQIVGYGKFEGQISAFIMSPIQSSVPEPGTWLMYTAGFWVVGVILRRNAMSLAS